MRRLEFASLMAFAYLVGCLEPTSDIEPAETFVTVERKLLPNELSRDDAAAGWIKLFDGESLVGWKQSNEAWRVVDNALVCDGAEPAMLRTATRFGDYELRWEVWGQSSTLGNIALGASNEPADTKLDGYEIRLEAAPQQNSKGAASGPSTAMVSIAPGDWTACSATIIGGNVTLGAAASQGASAAPDSSNVPHAGRIVLAAATGPIKFRNVYLKPLGMQALFNRQDLTGWHNAPGRPGAFETVIRLKEARLYAHQPGAYLETDELFDNFVFQTEVILNGRGFDAGILFRALDGNAETPAQGYELELNNGAAPDDASQEQVYGTGSLTGLTTVRRQVANDIEWFVPTLIADGPHFAVWINGEQVTDWTDSRPPAENPREGLRTAAGHIGLEAQGKKKKIDLFYQNPRIARLTGLP